ncbi:MAG: hypothetical protein KDA56_03395 [Hyphomonas sp.]|jgi:hypothetical protein|nr:hypothetical protein [Hyphomonas sp.]
MIRTASILAATLFLTTPASADPSTPKLHPVKKACVTYEMSGQMQSGTVTRCHRDYAYESYEIQNVTIGMAGFNQTQTSHTITIGNTIYAVDLASNTATKTDNPMYDGLVNALQNTSPEEMGAAFLDAMGMTSTGQTKTVAGETCTVYSSQMMGTSCFSSDWLMLEQSVMGMSQTATSVDRSSGGDDANYTLYQTVSISDGPDLSNLPGGLAGILGSGN